MNKHNFNQESLELHKSLRGKLEVRSKIQVTSKAELSVIYTPGVAEPCKHIARKKEDVYTYTAKSNTVAVVSDGSAVLGLGNIGPHAAIPVMEGKAILFKTLAGIDAFPICLASQDIATTIATVKNLEPVFGGINLEDIKAPECFIIEEALQDLGIPVMHDDQHGTAIVTLAGLINALNVVQKKAADVRIVINGAGAAAIATAKLLFLYGFKHLTLCDSKGVISLDRTDLNSYKQELAKKTHAQAGTLADAVKHADVFIGLSVKDALSQSLVKTMNKHPIIFAMANPDPEILPDAAKEAGAAVVATGRSDFPNQVNNALGFPGIFRGALDGRLSRITNEMKLAAARALASLVQPTAEEILPSVLDPRVVPAVAAAVKDAGRKL